ncbi:MAG TPA: GNAT family N-acetyltransferase [Ktedonobacteraceae bacterium]|nr:GNAT family N-acetyltransferase [Ktedonobacteraceae bacterium]
MMRTDNLPKGLTLRTVTMADLEAVSELVAAYEIADYGEAETTLEDMRNEWQSPNMNLETDTRVVTTPTGRMVGYAETMHFLHARIFGWLFVHPEYSEQGVREALLQWVEARAQEHIPLAAPDLRVTLNTGAASVNTAAKQLLERAGYQLIRHFWRMEIEMQEPPQQPQWAEGITVRPMRPGEERLVYEVDEESFQDHWGHMPTPYEKWEYWMVKRSYFDPDLWFMAFEGEKPIGISLCRRTQDGMGWVNTLGVLRPWRRKGVGMALLLHSFNEFYRRGWRKAGLSVDASSLTGATRLYERAGMHATRQYDSYQKELRPGREPSTQTISE